MIGLPADFLSFTEKSKGGGVMQVICLHKKLRINPRFLSICLTKFCPVIGQRVRVGQLVGCSRPEDQGTESSSSVCRRGSFALQIDRLLLQRGAFVRWKGGHDCVHKASHPRPWWELEPSRRHFGSGMTSLWTTIWILKQKNTSDVSRPWRRIELWD